MFGREIPCETTATRKVTVKPLIQTFDSFLNNQYFLLASLAGFETARQRYLASQKSSALLTELSECPMGQSFCFTCFPFKFFQQNQNYTICGL